MAGESPDRSKQHGASAEPTSGSGAPVPGPATADRDPRLAMTDEKVRVDQATAVFSTRALRSSAGSAVDEADTASESTAVRGNGAGGDAARRVSPASWVRSADEAESGSGSEAGSKSGAADGRSGDVEGAAAEETEGKESERSVDAEGEGADEEDTKAEDAAESETDTADTSEPETKAEDAAESETDTADTSGAEATTADASDAEPAAEEDAESGTEAGTASEAEAEEAPEADDKADGGEASDDIAEAGTGAEGKDTPKSEDKDDSEAEAEEGSRAAKPSVDQATAVFKTVRRPAVDQPTTMLKVGDAKPSEKPEDKAPEKPESKAPEKPESKPSEEPEDKVADKPAVDQPTTMLKLGDAKPSDKPAVDQPTTMLKLGGTKPSAKPGDKAADSPNDKPAPSWAAKSSAPATGKPETDKPEADKPEAGEAEPDAKSTPKPPAEGDAERTSRFVALKQLDEPKPAKPKSPAGPADATAALPQVGPERTAQQPLPPKPPLDLLAELTNTPPPPDTAVRTVLRRIKIWTPLVILLAIIFAIVQAVRPLPAAALTLTADGTYTFGGGKLDLPWPGQGQSAIEVEGVGVVGADGKQSPKPIASVTKIMTAYVTLQEHPLKGNDGGPKITVDQQAEDESKNQDESTAAMKKGEVFTERQMLQMLMIPSGNNAARLLARWDSGNKTFVGKMNAAAKKLGMTNTTYTDPSGLDKSTVSTAVDQLKLAKKVMQDPVFRSIVGMAKADIPGLSGTIYNNNDLLVKQVGVIGLKTGSSTPAGGNLVWAATKVVNGRTQTIYGAVLNQDAHTGRVWDSLQLALTNSQKLIDKIQQSLTSATVVKKGEVVGYVDDQLGGKTPVVATKNMTAVGWPGLTTKLSIGDDGKALPHEAKAGTSVGVLTVGDGSSHAVKIPVAVQKDLTEPGYGAKFTRLG
ncbi:serine hydrolase [Streptomyces sp. NPDC001795]|uniref:serine hydrolase n=1 Tax=Streptomyces sp. NPDC001795 TaxID=3154525 RepID=UPI00332D49F1